jgi:hypothetical protein
MRVLLIYPRWSWWSWALRGALFGLMLLVAEGASAGPVSRTDRADAETVVTDTTATGDAPADTPADSPSASDPHTDGGSVDGIYSCDADVSGSKQATFLTLNGKRDGKTVYLISSFSPDRQSVSGFGMGLVSGRTFSGATSDGKKFSFDIGFNNLDGDGAYEGVSLTGFAGLKTAEGKWVNAHLVCKSIW